MIIDCNVLIGPFKNHYMKGYSSKEVKQILRNHKISKALVASTKGIYYDDVQGNEHTLDMCRNEESFVPVGTINLSKYTDPDEEIAKRRGQNFKAFRLFNEYHNINLRGIIFKNYLRLLEKNNMPLMLKGTDKNLNSYIDDIAYVVCDINIPVIVLDICGYNLAQAIYAAKFAQNIYLSTRLFTTPQSLETFCEEVGFKRLVVGTGIPLYYGHQSLHRIQTSQVGREIKECIYSNNLISVLGGI